MSPSDSATTNPGSASATPATQPRLRRVEIILQIADALFPGPKRLQNLETRRIRERVKELRGASEID